MYRFDVLRLELLKMRHLSIDIEGSQKYTLDKTSKSFYVAEKYIRTAMFSNRTERFCTSELSGVGKNHGDTFWRHRKDTVIRTQKRLKTGKKDVMKNFFLSGH